MKRTKKVLSVLLVLCMSVLLFAGCGSKQASGDGKKPIVLKVAHYFAESHPQQQALLSKFKPMVEQGTNGAIKVEIYPNNQLGAEKEFIEGNKAGTIEMTLQGILLSEKYPVMKVAEFPYLFDSIDKGYQLMSDNLADITKGIENDGLRALGVSINGVRDFSTSKTPINSVEDVKGLKIRFPQVNQYVEFGKGLGINVISMPISEIFTALQQHVIEGQENPPTTVLANGWNEAQKYIALTEHAIAFNYVMVNDKFFSGLTPEQQDVIKKAVKAYTDEEVKLYKEAAAKDIETLKSKGVTITTPDKAAFKEAALKVYPKMMGDDPATKAMIDKLLAAQK